MAKKSYAVFGLGQFGRAICEQLVENGADVIAVDKDIDRVKLVSSFLNTCFVADATDEEALKKLNIKDVDVAIVAFGHNDQASILTTVLLREIGIDHIIVRVDKDYYIPIMKKLGASEIVSPQKAAGISIANRLGSTDYKDYYKLNSSFSVISIAVNEHFVPVSLRELKAKELYGVNLVLVTRKDGKSFVPGGNDMILPSDTVFVVGTQKDIRSFRNGINGKRNA